MKGRLNNLSARLLVNKWLASRGIEPLPSDLSYTDFATRLRSIVARGCVHSAFVSRSDAVAYVRHIARQYGSADPAHAEAAE